MLKCQSLFTSSRSINSTTVSSFFLWKIPIVVQDRSNKHSSISSPNLIVSSHDLHARISSLTTILMQWCWISPYHVWFQLPLVSKWATLFQSQSNNLPPPHRMARCQMRTCPLSNSCSEGLEVRPPLLSYWQKSDGSYLTRQKYTIHVIILRWETGAPIHSHTSESNDILFFYWHLW